MLDRDRLREIIAERTMIQMDIAGRRPSRLPRIPESRESPSALIINIRFRGIVARFDDER